MRFRQFAQRRPWLRLLIVPLFGACGDDVSPPAALIAESDFVAVYSRAACDALQNCCAGASVEFSPSACMTALTEAAQRLLVVYDPVTVYDGRRALDCVEKTRNVLSQCVSPFPRAALYRSCEPLRVGTLPIGAKCKASECAPSKDGPVRCISTTTDDTDTECVLDRPGMFGEPCVGDHISMTPTADHHLSCLEGLVCDETNHCAAPLPDGAECKIMGCSPGSWCAGSRTWPNPLPKSFCKPKAALGAACVDSSDCMSQSCYENKCAVGEPLAPELCFR
jgi:hypothetical protein